MFLKPDYPALSGLAAAFGALLLALGAPGAAAPGAAARAWRAFPRSVWTGRILTVVAMVWTTLWLPFMLLEFVPGLTPTLLPWLQVFLPVSIVAICGAPPELLACRSLGLLFVLAPTPLLTAAQYHPSSWRYLVIALAYAMVVSGMFFIARPWLARDAALWTAASPRRTRAVSLALAALGLALLLCAALAFPVAPGTPPLR